MRALSFGTLCQCGVQLTPGPRQRGHHSPYRNRGDCSDLFVGTPLQLSKDNYFTEAGRKRFQGSRKSLASIACNCDGIRAWRKIACAVLHRIGPSFSSGDSSPTTYNKCCGRSAATTHVRHLHRNSRRSEKREAWRPASHLLHQCGWTKSTPPG